MRIDVRVVVEDVELPTLGRVEIVDGDHLAVAERVGDLERREIGRAVDREVSFADLQSYVEQAFGVQAEEKGLTLSVSVDPRLPATMRQFGVSNVTLCAIANVQVTVPLRATVACWGVN